jgi:nucleoside-diphosphate-sugar epimerase
MAERLTAFVAGATGYTGCGVVAAATKAGLRTVAHVRPDSPRLDCWRGRFEALGAEADKTPWDLPAMTATMARVRPDLLFACLGTTQKRGRAARARGAVETYETVDYGLTVMLLDAAKAADVAPRFLYLSATGTSDATTNPYYRWRAKTERRVREGGLPFTIVRPSFISGPDREETRAGERVAAVVGDALLAVAGALGAREARERYRGMTGGDLGAAMVRLALDPTAAGLVAEGGRIREDRRIREAPTGSPA